MKYTRFEDLPVWQSAQDLAAAVYALVDHRLFHRTGDLRNQLQRSSLSISNNIAEGFERGSTAELLCHLYIARGSAGETRSALHFANRLTEISNLKSEISNPKSEISNLKSQIPPLIQHCESVSRQLRAWADSLQNSDIPGQRHLNDESRAAYAHHRRSRDFLEKIQHLSKRPLPDPQDPTPEQSEI